jgi:lipopolysaccharide export system permease protein
MFGFTILDRYIAWRFVTMIAATFFLCAGLIFMIDFVEIMRQAGKYGGTDGLTLLAITLLRLPAYSEILLTFAVLVGGIATFVMLARKSELAVIRAGGISVWAFLKPAIVVSLVLGLLAVTVYNPLAAWARAAAEQLHAEVFVRDTSFFKQQTGLPWLRQDGADGPSVLTAGHVAEEGLSLTAVKIFQFDRSNHFVERIDGKSARLEDGFWAVRDAWVTRPGIDAPRHFEIYHVSTYLNPDRVADALGSVLSLSFWELPRIIEVIEKAGLSAAGYRVQYHLLLSRPFLLVTMVLLAATVSLRSFRSGGIQTMVIIGMVGGIGFFLMAEVSRQVGVAGLVSPWVAAWIPVSVAFLGSVTVLLHQEDG